MQRFESRKHRLDVVVAVEETRRFLETFVPQLVPEDGDTNELLTDENRLLDEGGAVVAHLVHDLESGTTTSLARVLGRDREGVDKSLRVRFSDVGKNSLNELPNSLFRRVNAGDELEIQTRSVSYVARRKGRGKRRTCGMTSSHVSTETDRKPSIIALETSLTWPYLNQSVRRRRVSWRELPGERAMERKKAEGGRKVSIVSEQEGNKEDD